MYKRFIAPDAGEQRTLMVSRVLVVVLGVFALLQGAYFESILRAPRCTPTRFMGRR